MSGVYRGADIVPILGVLMFSRHLQYPGDRPSRFAVAKRLVYGLEMCGRGEVC